MADYFIGLMSGTSMDALDSVLVDFASTPPRLIASRSRELDKELRRELLALAEPGDNELDRLAQLDIRLGQISAQLCLDLLQQASISRDDISAIGSHGQTVRHAPSAAIPYTVQIGDPNTIAQLSGITTVADFRRRDMVLGGQGAPLVPAFHQALFYSSKKSRVILNIGGIANITILPADRKEAVSGFDTGPGNMLMDAWIQLHHKLPYDVGGHWASSGNIDIELLNSLMSEPYFSASPPKSTGRELYSLQWLEKQLPSNYRFEDVQATLCELTAKTIAQAIKQFAAQSEEVFVCGGGARNEYLMSRIRHHLSGLRISTTSELGLDPQRVEAMAFAWLARQTLNGLPGNLPVVTGASDAVILGGIYPAGPTTHRA